MFCRAVYGGLVTDAYHLSVVRAYIHYKDSATVELSSATVPGIADLPKARGALIYQFLQVTCPIMLATSRTLQDAVCLK